MPVAARIEQLIEGLKLNKNSFSRAIGLDNNVTIGRIINENRTPSFDVLEKILQTFGNVDANWLMTGEGQMFRDAHLNAPLSAHPSVSKGLEQVPSIITVDEVGEDNIVFVDRKAEAGYPTRVNEPSFFGDLPAFKLPSSEFRNGIYRAWEVEGDSMETTLHAGDWLITRFLDSFDHITEGHIHVVVTVDQVLVKRVLNRIKKNNRLILQSDNPTFGNILVEAEEVKELWIVKRFFSAMMGNRNKQLEGIVNNLTAETVLLKDRMEELEGKIKKITG